jgi:hypothetical protein
VQLAFMELQVLDLLDHKVYKAQAVLLVHKVLLVLELLVLLDRQVFKVLQEPLVHKVLLELVLQVLLVLQVFKVQLVVHQDHKELVVRQAQSLQPLS